MSEEPVKPGDEQPKDTPDIIGALRDLGQQFEDLFRTAIASDRAKQLQGDLASGARQITEQVEAAVKSLQADPRFQQMNDRGRDALHQVQQNKVVHDMQEALITGLSQISDQLRKLTERLQAPGEGSDASAGAPSQQVPVEQETPGQGPDEPATGETTKLDQ